MSQPEAQKEAGQQARKGARTQDQKQAQKQALINQRLKALAAKKLLSESISRSDSTDPIPLSSAQKRIWLMQQVEPDRPFANRPLGIHLLGALDKQILAQTISMIVERHEALRTIFPVVNGEPVQRVLPPWSVTLEAVSVEDVPAPMRQARARELAVKEAQELFDLATGPLIRPRLLVLSETEHVLLLLMHHSIFDGWSEDLLLSELRVIYVALAERRVPDLPLLTIQYRHYTRWQLRRQNDGALAKELSYWERRIGQPAAILELPTDHPRSSARSFSSAYASLTLPNSLTQSLKQFSKRAEATLFMVLLATFQLLLYRYTGQNKVAVGVPIAGRNHIDTELLIGVFMNTLVLQTELDKECTFSGLLHDVRRISLEAYSHQELPFEKLVEALQPERVGNRWPLFQVMFNFRNLPDVKPTTSSSLEVFPFKFNWGKMGGLDLSLEVKELPDTLQCEFSYPAELFDTGTVKRLAEHFRVLLEAVVANPESPVGTLPLMTLAEQRRVLFDWNQTRVDHPAHKGIPSLIEEQVRRSPDVPAVVCAGECLSYRQLNAAANQLAHYLVQQGAGPGVTIGICVERSLDMVTGLLAIVKAGSAYVPLDPEYPEERVRFILQDSHIVILLTQSHLQNNLPEHTVRAICLDTDRPLWAGADSTNPDNSISADSLAYVMYTSGTTGQPKGVMVDHQAACNHLQWRREFFPLSPSDRVLQKASLSFDDSFWEIFEPLTAGAQLVLAHSDKHLDMQHLIETIQQQEITALCLVPTLLSGFLENVDSANCTSLRRVTTGGEILSRSLRQLFFKRLQADLYNGYGPTEATVAVTYCQCQADELHNGVAIGKPISNARIYILDPHQQPVPIGIVGEIYIAGIVLAQGYINRRDLTEERFIDNPLKAFGVDETRLYKTGDRARYLPDGTLEFMGRQDNQIKLRGIRIELDEIKAVLNQHPCLSQIEVVVQQGKTGHEHLMAYISTKNAVDTRELRRYLRTRLPRFMTPSGFVFLRAFPLLPSGKVDLRALPVPDFVSRSADEEWIAPRTSVEKALGKIWCAQLKVEDVGINANFFEFGGHSLLAIKILTDIQKVFRVELPLRDIFNTPTIAELAELIENRQWIQAGANTASRNAEGEEGEI